MSLFQMSLLFTFQPILRFIYFLLVFFLIFYFCHQSMYLQCAETCAGADKILGAGTSQCIETSVRDETSDINYTSGQCEITARNRRS